MRCWSGPSWILCWGRHQSTWWWRQGKWGSELQWWNSQDKQCVMRQQENWRSDKHQIDQIGPLTFSPTPSLEDEDVQEVSTSADDDQAELMRRHFHLGYLPFNQLKQLAKNGKIPKKLTKLMPPWCAGCFFGAMTKVPWQTKGSGTGKQVFKATKPG